MVSYDQVYNAFLAKINADDWSVDIDQLVREADWRDILESAIVYFTFPRVSLDRDKDGFTDPKMSNDEIQVIATLMKCEWLERTVLSWENIKAQYDTQDFSQANLLDKLTNLLDKTQLKARRLLKKYHRDINGKPYPYMNLAGDGNG